MKNSLNRVLLADDHAMLLDAFRKLLEPHFEVVGTAKDGRELVKLASKLKPDVIVTDISMPLLNGLDAAAKIKKLQPDIKLVFVTVNEDPDLVAESFRIGGNGYLLKSSAASELFKAIEVVIGGGKYVTPLITGAMIGSLLRDPTERSQQHVLTTRQREILQLLAEGKTMKEAANILCVTSRTVAFHKYRIMEDLGIKTNSELIHYAIKQGLISI
ncbi:MAG: response regulator transcription factor [Xanthomonadales bacterium]|nr:response regulator transcription factor [Gammaproteobacteria bacterium]NNE04345.1 response regulator transcription factor [Xanthomonadales bacterium]NNL96021.1 response regulator transcription factor [Xanthomonadales bacterium]